MNFKKILSLVLSVMMILTSVSVFATEETTIPSEDALKTQVLTDLDVKAVPAYDLGAEEDLTLDFGMSFEALEDYEDAKEQPYFRNIVDFRLTFDKDVTAILAGQYGDFPWISIKAPEYTPDAIAGLAADVDGIQFKANEPVFIMGSQDVVNANLTYEDIITSVQKFDCGVKFAYNTLSGTTATLELVMVPAYAVEHEGAHYDDGVCDYVVEGVCYKYDRNEAIPVDTVEYTYNKNALGINTETTDVKKAEIIEEKIDEIVKTEEAAKGALDIIGTLDQDVKDEIAPETVKALVEASGVTVDETETKAYSVDPTVEVTVDVATVPADDFEDEVEGETVVEVYDIEATQDTVPVTQIDVPVLIAIKVADSSLVTKVLHLHDNVMEPVEFIRGDGFVYIQASKFSQYAVYSNSALQTGEAELKLVERDDAPRGQAWFDVVLAGADTDTIKGFIAGEFTVTPADTTVPFDYEIVNAAEDTKKEIAITYNELDSKLNGTREYLLDVHQFNKETSYTVLNATGTEITLAKLVVYDYGTGEIALSDVLFNRFDYDNYTQNLREEINVVRATGAAYDIEVPTQKLTIEIDFNHATETDNAVEYQDMWIEIVTADKVEKIELGNDNGDVEYTTNKYVVEKTVLANTEYRVYVKGAGYRTAIYNLNMGEEDRTLKFWNNNEDNAVAMEYVNGTLADAKVYNNNFLAGDIVMDREINIYDLSAVVSYFGERGIIGTANEDYVKYDLNRDGNIDSIDVAILLTSWGK